jgi:predicted membrane metal-binding protein
MKLLNGSSGVWSDHKSYFTSTGIVLLWAAYEYPPSKDMGIHALLFCCFTLHAQKTKEIGKAISMDGCHIVLYDNGTSITTKVEDIGIYNGNQVERKYSLLAHFVMKVPKGHKAFHYRPE